MSYKVHVLRAQQQIVHRLIWKLYISKNVFKYFACSMFVKVFNPFNMIFPLAGRQEACQLSCVPFPSISGTGNSYSWIWMVFQYCKLTIHVPVHVIHVLLLLRIKLSQWQAWNITSQDSKDVHSCPWLKWDVYKQVPVILLFFVAGVPDHQLRPFSASAGRDYLSGRNQLIQEGSFPRDGI